MSYFIITKIACFGDLKDGNQIAMDAGKHLKINLIFQQTKNGLGHKLQSVLNFNNEWGQILLFEFCVRSSD